MSQPCTSGDVVAGFTDKMAGFRVWRLCKRELSAYSVGSVILGVEMNIVAKLT